MIAVSLERGGLLPITATAVMSGSGGFTLPPPEFAAGPAGAVAPPTAKAAASTDVSHLMVLPELPLSSAGEAMDTKTATAAVAAVAALSAAATPLPLGQAPAEAAPAPPPPASPSPVVSASRGGAAARSPVAEPSSAIPPPIAEAAPHAVRRHDGMATAATATRRHKLPDPSIQITAAPGPTLPPPPVSPAEAGAGRLRPEMPEPAALVTSEPPAATSIERGIGMPAIGLPPTLDEDAEIAAAPLAAANTRAATFIDDVAPAVVSREVMPGSAPPASAALAAAAILSLAHLARGPVAPTPASDPGKPDQRAMPTSLLDTSAIALGLPLVPSEARPAPAAAASKDLAAAGAVSVTALVGSIALPIASIPTAVSVLATATVPPTATDPAAAAAIPATATVPTPAIVPTIDTAAFATPVPLRPTTPVARRDQPVGGQSPAALRERSDPPVYAIAAPTPQSPGMTEGAPSSASLRLDPTPPRPADFAIETPSLGAVGAEVTRRVHPGGDALHVHFAVDRSGTAALIAGASDGLAQAVAAAGNRLDAVTIEVRGGSTTASSGSDTAGSAGHRGDAPQHRPATPPSPSQAPTSRVRSPAIKPVVRDRFA